MTELDGMAAMLEEIRNAPEVIRPSQFWEHHTTLNLEQLEREGFGEFKRTVNRNYFQFQSADPLGTQQRAVWRAWLRRPRPAVFGARISDRVRFPPEAVARIGQRGGNKAYAVYLALLWEYVRSRDSAGVLDRLDEPLLGHPVYVDYRGRRISEDLCNSALELISILDATAAPRTVIELGSGYGRVAWAFASVVPDVRYLLVDIPPALAIAQEYLGRLFPDRRLFRFRHFTDAGEIEAELADAQLAFLTPNQLDLLPPQGAELFINISSLHEMRPDQVEHYLGVVARHTAGHFYTKQWLRSVNPHDGVVITRTDYPIPGDWQPIFDRTHPIQVEFFEALYSVGADAG